MYKFLILIMIILFSCSERTFDDNIFDFDSSENLDSSLISSVSLSFSSDTVEISTNMYINVLIGNIPIDSINYDFDGDSIVDHSISNHVKSFPHMYTVEGTFMPAVYVYSTDSIYELKAQLVVVKKGSHLGIQEIVLDTTDSLTDGYVEDTTLSIGSAPLIAYLEGGDTLYVNSFKEFTKSGALAFDEEDGEITEITEAYDQILLTLPDSSIITKTAYITYSAKDSHGNITYRDRTCLISNPNIIYNFDFFKPDLDGFIVDERGQQLEEEYGTYVSDQLEMIPKKSTNNFYFKALLLPSEKRETIFNIKPNSADDVIRVTTYNDTLETIVLNHVQEADTTKYFPIVFSNNFDEYIISIQEDQYKLYINKELVYEKTMENDYSILRNYRYNYFSFYIDLDGNFPSGSIISNFKIIQLELTPENVGGME